MKPEELEKIPLRIEKMFYEMQNRVLDDIVRRINKTGEITSTADYQIEKLKIFGNSSEYIESEIKRVLKASDAEIWELYDQVIDKQYTRDKSLYEQINAEFIPYDENEMMQAWVKAAMMQTKGDLENLTRSLGFSVIMGNKRVFTPLSEYYQKYLDRACLDIVTGVFDYNTVLRRVVKEMTDSGIRTVDYASGHSNRVTVAARRAVMTGVRQLTGQINEMTAQKLGTDSYEVEWHSGARPTHWWGGMVFTMDELKSVCGLGTGPGLCGWNCYHSYHAFIPGVSVRTYTDKQLAEMNAKELETHTWKGKEYNAYQATQYQRKMETTMRAQRSTVRELQRGDGDKDTIEQAKARYQGMLHQYNKFSRTMKLEPQMERVYLDGLGRVVNTGYHKKTNTGGEKHVIIKAQKTTPYATPDSITQITGKQGGTTRNYYDSDGKWYKQISNNNHGNAKHHPYGKNGEHAHDILWDNDKIVSRPTRELTDRERKENKDIL
jgi:hypothetical protein|uniref:Minor capsid protein n=1 Tax=Siphoviridae sp. ctWDo30 TaxID=2826360 RepID=A0A8S5N6E6_9CAUD|nr:MAG TPA: minor capsid protein [Siphoviridae sp. ctWDo30]